MLAVAVVLGILLLFAALVVLALGAWLRADEARRGQRILLKRIQAIEKQLGIARPEAAAPAAAPAARAPAAGPSLEERIALVWFARIGAVTLLVGAAFLFLYEPGGGAFSRAGRVGAGALAGLGAIAFVEATRERTRSLYSQVVLGMGLAVLLASAFAAHALYHLVPAGAALAAVGAIALAGGALSVRHRGEAALVVSLAGGLLAGRLLWPAAPPWALFAWLLLASTLAAAVAVRMGFRWGLWIATLGAFAALAAWYAVSFDVRAPGPGLAAGGRHLRLTARLVPLGFAAAFLGAWLTVQARARASARLAPRAYLVAALLLGHALLAALLPDSPALLGLALAALGALSALFLARDGILGLLAVPLLVDLFALLGAAAAPGAWAVTSSAAFAAWGAAYLAAFAHPPAGAGLSPRASAALAGLAAVAFLVLAGEVLAPHHPLAFGAAVVAWSAGLALLARRKRAPALLAATAAVALLGLLGAGAPATGAAATGLALLGGLWALVYSAGVAFAALARDEDPGPIPVAVASAAAVASPVLALVLTLPAERALRAALFAAAAAVHLGLGLALRRRAPRRAAGLHALGVALFAGAASLLIPGAAATLAWALLATALVAAGFASRSALVRSLGLGLFAATLAKLALWDVWTLPRAYQVPVFLAVGALLLAASYLYARRGGRLRELWREDDGRPGDPDAGSPPETTAGGD